MPSSSMHPCPDCGVLVRGQARCQAHARKADLSRGTAKERGYDQRWATFSKAWRNKYPLCGMRADGQVHNQHRRSWCVEQGIVMAQCVDHIIPMSRGGSQYSEHNLQSLCLACNTAKGHR